MRRKASKSGVVAAETDECKSPCSSLIIITTSLGSGGAEKQALLLARSQVARRKVRVFSMYSQDHEWTSLAADLDVSQLHLRRGMWGIFNPKVLSQIRSLGSRSEPMCVVSFNYPALVLVLLLQILGAPIRHIVSERQEDMGSLCRRWVRRLSYGSSAALTANSNAAAGAMSELSATARHDGVVIVRNFLTEAPAKPAIVSERDRSETRRFHWVSAGRLTEQKGYEYLISACSILRERNAEFSLDIFGEGELRDVLQSQIHTLDLSSHVKLRGFKSDLWNELLSADGVVSSSMWEGVPNILLEAVQIGKPIVATSVGDNAEVFGSDSVACLARPGSSEALAYAMFNIITMNERKRSRMVAELQAQIKELHRPSTILQAWEQAFKLADK